MSGISKRIARLSPEEKREYLARLLRKKANAPKRFPMSFSQKRLWFIDQLEPNAPTYNVPISIRLTGALGMAALEQCFDEIVSRHESLRTTFAESEGRPVQIVAPELRVTVSVVDLRGLPLPAREPEAVRVASEEALVPFDLAHGPLLRVTLLRMDRDEHVMLLSMHHIISDGWSTEVLIRELEALYNAFVSGDCSPLRDLPIQYADFAVWQRGRLKEEALDFHVAYWKNRLDGAATFLDLPADHARPSVQTFRGKDCAFKIEPDTVTSLKLFSRKMNATLFMTLLGAFQTLLYRHTGCEDIVVGTPVANRNRREIESLIGFLANTMVIRTDFSGDPSFRDLLLRVRETALEAYAHQDLPFEKLVEEIRPERLTNRNPLFQVMFVLGNAPLLSLDLTGLVSSRMRIDRSVAMFDLSLSMLDTGRELVGYLEYSTDLFEEATIQRLLRHFQIILAGIGSAPEVSVSVLPVLTEAERHQLLREWNDTRADSPMDRCLHELFEARVELTPDAPAVVFEEEQVSYRELNRRSNQLAHYLGSLGVGPEIRVGIFMERSVEMIVGILGILKAGGTYVPLALDYPKERIALILEDTAVEALLTRSGLLERLPEDGVRRIFLDTDWDGIGGCNEENPDVGVRAENPAYILYTSGSTGRPKGVCCNHAGVGNLLADFQGRRPLAAGARCSMWTNSSFDVSVYEIFSPLVAGGTLHIAPDDLRFDGARFMDWLVEHHIISAYVPPFMLEDLSNRSGRDHSRLSLERLLVGVEPIPLSLLGRIDDRLPDLHVINGYGPTETTICATLYPVGSEPVRDGNAPIGRPVMNSKIYLLDSHLQSVPIGVRGELFIGGAGLARCYIANPVMTADRFVPDPYGGDPGARLYRTGDTARRLPDGNIEFLGRLDDQVKIRGYRIELGEIEAALSRYAGVRDCVVAAREGAHGDTSLVAYVVPDREAVIATDEVRTFLQQRLPGYMVPSFIVLLGALPLTSSGKVDRRLLPPPEEVGAEREESFTPPRNPTEEVLAGVWEQVLGVNRIDVHDSFFELGGHSLLATKVVSRIRETFRVEVPLRGLFESPTVAGMAERVETIRRQRQGFETEPIPPAPRDGAPDLSFAQRRLWFVDKLMPGNPVNNIPTAVRLSGHLSVAALRESFNEILRRHEVLRTTFAFIEGGPVQVIAPFKEIDLPVVDMGAPSKARRAAEVEKLATETARMPFNLQEGPLMRVCLLRLGREEHVLLLTVHHIVSDGWSAGIFLRELSELYRGYSVGEPSSLGELPLQYADFAAWQREWFEGGVLDSQLAYWKEQLRGISTLELPADRHRPPIQTFRGARQPVRVPRELVDGLKALGRREGSTLFMTLLAAFNVLLHTYSGQDDIAVGSPIAGRSRIETEDLIGFFVNTLVLRSDLTGDPSFREYLGRVREVALEAYTNQDLPFEKLVEELQPKRDLSRNLLFQVMLVLQNAPVSRLVLPGLDLEFMEVFSGTTKFDLTLSMFDTERGLKGALDYNSDVFDSATIDRLLGHFRMLLEKIVADPDRPLSDVACMTDAERQRVLVEWNRTGAEYPEDVCIHELFEDRVRLTPEAVAVVHEYERLTYRVLNERANQMAHYLADLGVGPETRVGVYLERSTEMIVGLLGILKAGGAYVPLDPNYPKDRLAFILEDAGLEVLLSSRRLVEDAHGRRVRIVCLEECREEIARQSMENPVSGVTPADISYVIYTSGSTGRPKGVMIEHRSVLNLLTGLDNAVYARYGNSRLRVGMNGPLAFDTSVKQIIQLLRGHTLDILPEDVRLNTADLLTYLRCGRIDSFDCTPSYLGLLIEAGLLDNRGPAVKCILLGGEAVGGSIWRALRDDRFTDSFNLYGPTECAVDVTVCPIRTGPDKPVIGRPIVNTRIYILDRLLRPVPLGAAGELAVGGVGLARGYLGRPGMTAERFVPDPFGGERGGRLYRTGDLCRYMPDGSVEFLGRIDRQVKIRGFRVELGEVESVLTDHDAIRECVVIVYGDDHVDDCLVACSVYDDYVPSLSLRRFLAEILPDYMIPSRFIQVDEIPLTPHGKIDHEVLHSLVRSSTEEWKLDFVPPRSETEKTIARIWRDVLNIDKIGLHDNFFDLGGHSLVAIKAISMIEDELKIRVPFREFINKTLGQFAVLCEGCVIT